MTDEYTKIPLRHGLEGVIVKGNNVGDALVKASKVDGFLPTMPEFIRMLVNDAPTGELFSARNLRCLTSSEECSFDVEGIGKGLLVIHGTGLIVPEMARYKSIAQRSATDYQIGQGMVECLFDEGSIGFGGEKIPIIHYEFLRTGVVTPPRKFGVIVPQQHIVDVEEDRARGCGNDSYLESDPLFIARCGGKELAMAAIREYRERFGNEGYATNSLTRMVFSDYSQSKRSGKMRPLAVKVTDHFDIVDVPMGMPISALCVVDAEQAKDEHPDKDQQPAVDKKYLV